MIQVIFVQVTFTLSEAAAERGMIDGAGQLYRKSRRGGTATLQQLPGVIFMPEGSPAMTSIFNALSDANQDRNSTTEPSVSFSAIYKFAMLDLHSLYLFVVRNSIFPIEKCVR